MGCSVSSSDESTTGSTPLLQRVSLEVLELCIQFVPLFVWELHGERTSSLLSRRRGQPRIVPYFSLRLVCRNPQWQTALMRQLEESLKSGLTAITSPLDGGASEWFSPKAHLSLRPTLDEEEERVQVAPPLRRWTPVSGTAFFAVCQALPRLPLSLREQVTHFVYPSHAVLDHKRKDRADRVALLISSTFPNLVSIRFRTQTTSHIPLTDSGVEACSSFLGCGVLRFLDLSGAEITDATLLAIARVCPHLRVLRVNDCHDISDGSVAILSLGCLQLEELGLSDTAITDKSLHAIGELLPELRAIDLQRVRNITEMGLEYLVAKGDRSRLEYLNLCGLDGVVTPRLLRRYSECLSNVRRFEATDERMDDESIALFVTANIQLEWLNVSRTDVGEKALRALLRCTRLRHLDLHGTRIGGGSGGDDALAALAECTPCLEYLNLSHTRIGHKGLAECCKYWERLKHLELSSNPSLNDDSLALVGQRLHASLECFVGSSSLAAGGGGLGGSFGGVAAVRAQYTDNGVRKLLTPFAGESLRSLNLSYTKITDDSLKCLLALSVSSVPSQPFSSLEEIYLNHVQNITDGGVEALARACPSLSTVVLDQTNVTDTGVLALGRHCQHLRHVHLRGLAGVTDKTTKNIALSAIGPQLEVLNVVGTSVTRAGCEWIDEYCHRCRLFSSL